MKGKGIHKTSGERFKKRFALAEEAGISCQYLHMASSATLMAFPSYSASAKLVRPGIMLYGSYPSPTFRPLIPLKPVMTLKTHIHFLKRVPSGARVSYGGTFTTERNSLIATLPIGYADGYSRHLSNRGEVLSMGRERLWWGKSVWISSWWMSPISKGFSGDEVILMGSKGESRSPLKRSQKKSTRSLTKYSV